MAKDLVERPHLRKLSHQHPESRANRDALAPAPKTKKPNPLPMRFPFNQQLLILIADLSHGKRHRQ
jgi:hypothetical protein